MKRMFVAAMVSVMSVAALVGCSDSTNEGSGGQGASDSSGGMGGASSVSSTGSTGSTSASSSGAGGAGGMANTCDNSGNCTGCQSCAQKAGGPCADKAAAFQMLPNAMTFYNCVVPCNGKPTPAEQTMCAQACCMANQPECMAYNAFVLCALCDTCPMDCAAQAAACPP